MGSREMPMAPRTSLVRKREPRAPPARSAAMRTRERARTRPKTRKARKAKAERAKRRMKEEVSSGWMGARREPRVNRAAEMRTTEIPPTIIQSLGGRLREMGVEDMSGFYKVRKERDSIYLEINLSVRLRAAVARQTAKPRSVRNDTCDWGARIYDSSSRFRGTEGRERGWRVMGSC